MPIPLLLSLVVIGVAWLFAAALQRELLFGGLLNIAGAALWLLGAGTALLGLRLRDVLLPGHHLPGVILLRGVLLRGILLRRGVAPHARDCPFCT